MFDLKRACNNCPFRKGEGEKYQLRNLNEIVTAPAFQCHKTLDNRYNDGDERRKGSNPQQCVGLMALLHKEGESNQIMQVGERIMHFHPSKLDTDGLYDSLNDAFLAHGCPRKEPSFATASSKPPRISGQFTPPVERRTQPATPMSNKPPEEEPPTEWKLVPVKPTRLMLSRGYAVHPLEKCWMMMIEAAPEPPKAVGTIPKEEDTSTDRFKAVLEEIHQEDEVRGAHMQMLHVRKFLADALCCICGERLGEDDADIMSDDEDRTVHLHCEEAAGPPEEDEQEEGM